MEPQSRSQGPPKRRLLRGRGWPGDGDGEQRNSEHFLRLPAGPPIPPHTRRTHTHTHTAQTHTHMGHTQDTHTRHTHRTHVHTHGTHTHTTHTRTHGTHTHWLHVCLGVATEPQVQGRGPQTVPGVPLSQHQGRGGEGLPGPAPRPGRPDGSVPEKAQQKLLPAGPGALHQPTEAAVPVDLSLEEFTWTDTRALRTPPGSCRTHQCPSRGAPRLEARRQRKKQQVVMRCVSARLCPQSTAGCEFTGEGGLTGFLGARGSRGRRMRRRALGPGVGRGGEARPSADTAPGCAL